MMSLDNIPVSTIGGINRLQEAEKRRIYSLLIPQEIRERFNLAPDLVDQDGSSLLILNCPDRSSSVEMTLFHRAGFQDPILYGHITDTLSGHIHVLLYVLNDPDSPRFDIDCMPDGSATKFGTVSRNIPVEIAAMQHGLAPGQIRRGLRMLGPAIAAFDQFVTELGQELYFTEPLHYHNAVIFEQFGFGYQQGRKLMDRINRGFGPQGDLLPLLDGSTPFRQPSHAGSIRLRSWAIHDNLLGAPFSNVTMYKRVGKSMRSTAVPACPW